MIAFLIEIKTEFKGFSETLLGDMTDITEVASNRVAKLAAVVASGSVCAFLHYNQ